MRDIGLEDLVGNSARIVIRKPCILGYVVEPFPAFPLRELDNYAQDVGVSCFCGTDTSCSKFTSTAATLTDSDKVNEVKPMSAAMREAIKWPPEQIFHVYFVKPEKHFEFFENFV